MLDDLLLGNYKRVADRLGLVIEGAITAGDLWIHGPVDGVAIELWFGSHSTHTSAKLATAAPFELSVVATGLLSRLAHLFTGAHVALGDPDFDQAFAVKAADLSRVAALLDRDTRSVLIGLARDGLHPAVHTSAIDLRRFSQGGVDAEATIEHQLRETARLARVIGAAYGSVTQDM